MNDLILPAVVERMYRDLAHFKPSRPPAQVTAEAKQITLARDDVTAILLRTRSPSAEQLQQILSRERELMLTNTQREQIALDLSLLLAHRFRQANGPRDNPTDEFISKVLGYSETPFGLVERGWVNAELRAGSTAILRCKNHKPPDCACSSSVRATLW